MIEEGVRQVGMRGVPEGDRLEQLLWWLMDQSNLSRARMRGIFYELGKKS
jgi:hypothetical protein